MTADASDPTVGELSEGQILRRILARFRASAAWVGPGDDAAVIAAPDGAVVATTDTLVHGPDFRLAWSSGFDLGWKSAAVNLADIAAMGARPTALLVALALPGDTRMSFVEQVADGLRAACDELAPGSAVEGGDLTVSDTLVIAVTALGSLDGRAPVLRSGARVGDTVAIAGDLGLAGRGLDILFDRYTAEDGTPLPLDRAILTAPTDADAQAILAQLRPRPPIASGVRAATAGARALMDVSDGLALDATRMADASGITIDLHSSALLADGVELRAALWGGEDHGMVGAFSPGAPLPEGFRPIGAVIAREAAPLLLDGSAYSEKSGWDPYRDWDSGTG